LAAVLSDCFVSNTFAISNLITEPSAGKMETTSCLTTAAREIIFSEEVENAEIAREITNTTGSTE